MNFWLWIYRIFHLIASTVSLFICLGMMLYFDDFSQIVYQTIPSWLKGFATSLNQNFGTLGYKLFWLMLAVYFLTSSYRMVSQLQQK